MRLKIVSDGTPLNTRVLDENGQRIEMVKAIDWHIDSGSLATATIKLVQVPVEVEGEQTETLPNMGSSD